MEGKYTQGNTYLYHQGAEIESNEIRKYYNIQTAPPLQFEEILPNKMSSIATYPFCISSNSICNIRLKLNDTSLTITNEKIVSNKPIFIKNTNNEFYVWNTEFTPNYVCGSKGNTYIDGYNAIDFDGNLIKCNQCFYYLEWNIPTIVIKQLVLSGDNNNIVFKNMFNKTLDIKISGINNLDMANYYYESLNINIDHTIINFNESICNILSLEIRGTGKTNGLCIESEANITIIGSNNLNIKKNINTKCYETIYGAGKINWQTI